MSDVQSKYFTLDISLEKIDSASILLLKLFEKICNTAINNDQD